MKKIGLIGSQLIHTYAYAMHFNKPDLEYASKAKTVPAWQLEIMKRSPGVKLLGEAQITHIWGGLEGVPEDNAGTFNLKVCKKLSEVLEACDLIMVMDENIESRSELIRKALEAGRHVFADKIPSDKFAVVSELVELAGKKNVALAAWSQMGYCPEYQTVRAMPQGGTALVSFSMAPDIIKKYGIHIICSAQGCFPGKIMKCAMVDANDKQCLFFVENEHGTKMILGVGGHYPSRSRIDYNAGNKAAVVENVDIGKAFHAGAKEILGLLEGKTPVFNSEKMLEAAKLLEKMSGDLGK
ncbi:MAG: Gfo/Idh/MocA family oxidoreductase [Verrucomicrobiota bacterium]